MTSGFSFLLGLQQHLFLQRFAGIFFSLQGGQSCGLVRSSIHTHQTLGMGKHKSTILMYLVVIITEHGRTFVENKKHKVSFSS